MKDLAAYFAFPVVVTGALYILRGDGYISCPWWAPLLPVAATAILILVCIAAFNGVMWWLNRKDP